MFDHIMKFDFYGILKFVTMNSISQSIIVKLFVIDVDPICYYINILIFNKQFNPHMKLNSQAAL